LTDLGSLFTETERRAIADAAANAEGSTSGEIVPYVVGACDDYPETGWKAAVLGALAGGGGGVAVHYLGGFWGGSPWLWVILPLLVCAVAAAVLARWSDDLRRWLIGNRVLDLRARQRAETCFLDEEVFATRDRTGILIFVALFERRVVVMGDAGINRAVPEGAWNHVVDDLIAGIRAGRPAAALTAAIGECGRLLREHRLEIRPDDTDELANELRIRDR
jgi:putative membrane protein